MHRIGDLVDAWCEPACTYVSVWRGKSDPSMMDPEICQSDFKGALEIDAIEKLDLTYNSLRSLVACQPASLDIRTRLGGEWKSCRIRASLSDLFVFHMVGELFGIVLQVVVDTYYIQV